jgi:hypothetical protein
MAYRPSICGRPVGYPAADCTREYGHEGDHWHSATHLWLAEHDAQVVATALREAARLARFLWTGTTNLPDLDDAEVGYSFDRWLEVYADRIEREGGEE